MFSMKGIDGEGEILTLSYRELEAVVSKVSLEEFDSEAIQIKAQNDLNWIKEKAVIHERVIEEAMRKDDKILGVIPMSFGIIFKKEAKLIETLDKNYEKIQQALDNIRGKQQWGLKVYLKDKKILEQRIKAVNGIIKEREKEIASLPEGMAFFMEEDLREIINREMNKELNDMMDVLFETFKKHAVDSIRNKNLEKELTGRSEPMVLNAAYLILDEKIEGFKKEAKRLKQEFQAKGFYLEYNGPWPAYDFAKLL